MTFIEFLGFVISLAAMIFLVVKKIYEDAQRRKNPLEYAKKEKEREENLRKFLNERGIDYGESKTEKPAQVKKIVRPPRAISREPQEPQIQYRTNPSTKPAALSEQGFGFDLKPAESYEVIRKERHSAATLVVKELKSPRDMIIIKEIFDKPLSMR